MAIATTQNNYWMSPSAITFTLNALEDPDYNQVTVLGGAVIMAFVQGVIDYDASRNYRKWTLEAFNSYFETSDAKLVFARLEKRGTKALIVYSDDELALSSGDYYYIYLGKISASVNSNGTKENRYWEDAFKTGILSTNQFINEETGAEWRKLFRWNKVTDLIEVLKTFSSFVVNNFFVRNKEVTDIKRSIDDDKDVPVTDQSLTTAKYVSDGIKALEKKYIRKDQEDETEYLVRLLNGAEFGNFIKSMIAGKGAGVDADGNMQVESIEVRSYMKVMELVYNRLSAMEGDFIFTESGTVDTIEQIDSTTYRLNIRKRWDNDFTAFKVGDVLRGVVNALNNKGEYYTAFMRVLNVNITANNIIVSVYPEIEVPSGKNHPPTALMVLQRWGNTFDTERQSTWYLSSNEGRIVWLTGVTKPILEEHNYSSFYGKPVNLSIFDGQHIDYNEPYLYVKGLIAENLIKVDHQGNIIKEFRDRGLWISEPEVPYRNMSTLQDDVWHYGAKWRCLVDETGQEPTWNATDWQQIEGSKDITCELYPTNGEYFYADDVDFILHWDVKYGYININNDIHPEDVEWTRDSGDITSDNLWAVIHSGTYNDLNITNDDIGQHFDTNGVTFKVRIYVRDGAKITELVQTFGV